MNTEIEKEIEKMKTVWDNVSEDLVKKSNLLRKDARLDFKITALEKETWKKNTEGKNASDEFRKLLKFYNKICESKQKQSREA